MKSKQITFLIATLTLATGAIGVAYAQQTKPPAPAPPAAMHAAAHEDDEVIIKLADAPQAVRDAIAKLTADKNIKQVSRETDDGVTIFEVEYESAGKSMSADLSEKGDVLIIDTKITADSLTDAASRAIKKAYPKGTIKGTEAVQEFYYEVIVEVDGKRHEVKVTATGEVKGKEEVKDNDKD